MIGYIDKARQSGIESEAATVKTALQTASTDVYGKTKKVITAPADYKLNAGTSAATWTAIVGDLVGTSYPSGEGIIVAPSFDTKGVVTGFTFRTGDYKCVYTTAGGFVVSPETGTTTTL